MRANTLTGQAIGVGSLHDYSGLAFRTHHSKAGDALKNQEIEQAGGCDGEQLPS